MPKIKNWQLVAKNNKSQTWRNYNKKEEIRFFKLYIDNKGQLYGYTITNLKTSNIHTFGQSHNKQSILINLYNYMKKNP